MIKGLSGAILKALGWKVQIYPAFFHSSQSVVMMAPHTSNWDFFYGYLGIRSVGVTSNFLIKDSFFFFPLNKILRKMGGIPVNRASSNQLVQQLVDRFHQGEIRHLGVAVEGTRSYVDKWHSGAYHVAVTAQVPIFLGYIDFAKKEVGIAGMLDYSGNFEQDLVEIKHFYQDKVAKYPEKFSLSSMHQR